MKKAITLLLVLTMVLALTGCKKDDYESAVALMDAGSYAEAIVAFAELGDYEDSAQRLEECKNITTYAEATALFEAENYEEALKLFTALGNYEDCAEKCVECQNAITYNEAVALVEAGSYIEAKAIFETIPDYRDVAEYLARYQTVEITEENWDNYFTIVQAPWWQENAFGEGELIYIIYGLAMLDEYIPKMITADVAFGFEYRKGTFEIEIDKDNFAYTIKDKLLYKMYDKEESTVHFTEKSRTDGEWVYRDDLWIAHCEVYEDNAGVPWSVYDAREMNLTRVQGSITIFL